MFYTVKYRRGLLWKTLKQVVADGFVDDKFVRFFILKDGRRIEIDCNNTIFIFSKERNENIKQDKKE